MLAETDFYGLGPGRYPPERIPAKPHPRCLCGTRMVLRPVDQWGEPRQPAPPIRLLPDAVAQQNKLTPSQGRGLRDSIAVGEGRAGSAVGGAGSPPPPPAPPPEPPGESGEERLRRRLRRSERFLQEQRLEHAVAFDREGREVLRKTSGERAAVYFTDEEVRQLKDTVFTHNHPNAGGSFSPEDVAFGIRYDLGEVRAVDGVRKRYVYSLRRPAGGWAEDLIEQVERVRQDAEREVVRLGRERIERGDLSPEDANYEHWHEVWIRVAEVLGLDYHRLPWED